MKKKIFRIVSAVVLIYVLYFGILYFFQNYFLFSPGGKYINPGKSGDGIFKEIVVSAYDGTPLMSWYFEGDKDKPLILFFHGNTGQIARFAPAMKEITKAGYSIAMVEYRGFGNTKGKISQDIAFLDAASLYNFYKTKTGKKIVLYGYSFGCAFAMGLTQYVNPDGIILTAPFASLYREIREYPVPWAYFVLKDKYPSDEYIKNIKCPILIIHGLDDKLIDCAHSFALAELAPVSDKNLVVMEGVNHHDIYFKELNVPSILDWLKKYN